MPVHFPSESGLSAETPHGRSNGRTPNSVRLGLPFSATRNPGDDQNFTDPAAVVQRRLRVAVFADGKQICKHYSDAAVS
jgi:hypothetical protein